MRLLRLARIFTVVWRYRLDEIVVSSLRNPTLVRLVPVSYTHLTLPTTPYV